MATGSMHDFEIPQIPTRAEQLLKGIQSELAFLRTTVPADKIVDFFCLAGGMQIYPEALAPLQGDVIRVEYIEGDIRAAAYVSVEQFVFTVRVIPKSSPEQKQREIGFHSGIKSAAG